MKSIPTVQKYMTPVPHTVGADLPLSKAWEMMKEFQIRHLPVLRAGKLAGILSDRDIKLANSLKNGELKCEDAMTPDPYSVRPETDLNTAVQMMAQHKYGSAIVTQADGRVVGILTVIDALKALSELLVA